jgi:hypothetical protein
MKKRRKGEGVIPFSIFHLKFVIDEYLPAPMVNEK